MNLPPISHHKSTPDMISKRMTGHDTTPSSVGGQAPANTSPSHSEIDQLEKLRNTSFSRSDIAQQIELSPPKPFLEKLKYSFKQLNTTQKILAVATAVSLVGLLSASCLGIFGAAALAAPLGAMSFLACFVFSLSFLVSAFACKSKEVDVENAAPLPLNLGKKTLSKPGEEKEDEDDRIPELEPITPSQLEKLSKQNQVERA